MDPKSAFKRAALVHSCRQSRILRNIDYEQTDTNSLVELVNQHNSQSIRELPIIVTKVTIKGILGFMAQKFPSMRTYVNPENIKVCVEDDEMAYLISTPAKKPTSLVAIVAKNIAISTVGASITQLKNDLLGRHAKDDENEAPYAKIKIAQPSSTLNATKPPASYSDFGSPAAPSASGSRRSSVVSVKRLSPKRKLSTRSSASSVSSGKGSIKSLTRRYDVGASTFFRGEERADEHDIVDENAKQTEDAQMEWKVSSPTIESIPRTDEQVELFKPKPMVTSVVTLDREESRYDLVREPSGLFATSAKSIVAAMRLTNAPEQQPRQDSPVPSIKSVDDDEAEDEEESFVPPSEPEKQLVNVIAIEPKTQELTTTPKPKLQVSLDRDEFLDLVAAEFPPSTQQPPSQASKSFKVPETKPYRGNSDFGDEDYDDSDDYDDDQDIDF